ncbi:MAG: PHP domain-containing protein [Ruminococcaceae bacterium]|nr:PHP domain-containing protein [Oscillospiraceae bacterium]
MIYYDFHIHSALSPCGDKDMTPNNIVNMAALSGLDAIAISDHNSAWNVRAAMKVGEVCGVKVIPGMEVETAEEVHILTLYPTIEAAEYAAEEIYKYLPNIKNRPEIFGEQLKMNEDDEVVGVEEKLLISPTTLSIEGLFDLVKTAKGLFIPAHVDRHSYSVLTNLGFIPDNLDIRNIEMSKKLDCVEDYLNQRPDLRGYKIFRNSDAHYLENISQRDEALDINDVNELFKEVI